MIYAHSFQADRRFWGEEHFPYGFSRSGEFTCEQARLLETHGQAYIALANGIRLPVTEEEEAFVAFCKGDKSAESSHEKAWKRYQDCLIEITRGYCCSFGVDLSARGSDYSSQDYEAMDAD
jgi:hypothetical protein